MEKESDTMIWKELIRCILSDVQEGKEPKQEYYKISQKEWENVIHLIVIERYAVNVIFQRDFIEWDRVFICMKNAKIGYAGELFLNNAYETIY